MYAQDPWRIRRATAAVALLCGLALLFASSSTHLFLNQDKSVVSENPLRRRKRRKRKLLSSFSKKSGKSGNKHRSRAEPDCSDFSHDSKDQSGPPPPCRLGPDDYIPPAGPENQLRIGMLLGLPPGKKSLAPLLTDVLTNMWSSDAELTNMNFHLGKQYEGQFDSPDAGMSIFTQETGYLKPPPPPPPPTPPKPSNQGGSNRKNRNPYRGDGNGGNSNSNRGENNDNNRGNRNRDNSNGRKRSLEDRYRVRAQSETAEHAMQSETTENDMHSESAEHAMVFDMHHTESDSKLVKKNQMRWWWHVNMTFQCMWEDTGTPVGFAMMTKIQTNITNTLSLVRETVQIAMQNIVRDPLIRVRTEAQGAPDPKNDDADTDGMPTPAPVASPLSRTKDPLNAGEWDWRKTLGLVLLMGTLVGALFTNLVAARRQQMREQQQQWGNLASRQGLDRLLATAWAFEGNRMKIYDKSGMGYTEDDGSLFLGGFEQKETVVGTEITLTHPGTSETQEVSRSQLSGFNSQGPPARSQLSYNSGLRPIT